MPRAARGVIARLAMRRILPGHPYFLADVLIGQEDEYSPMWGGGSNFF